MALGTVLALLLATAAHAQSAKASASASAGAGYSARALVGAAQAALAAGHPGAAVVELERARLLAPRSAVVAHDLVRAREVAGVPPAPRGRVRRLVGLLSGTEWSRLALAGLALGGAGVVWLSWGAARRRRALGLVVGGAALASLGFLGARDVTPSPEEGVVVAAAEPARIAPFPAAEPAFPLSEGAAVRVMRAHGDYVLVSAAEGRGWLPRSSVETILPETARRP